MNDRRTFLAGLALVLFAGAVPATAAPGPSPLARSLADPARSRDRSQDARRHPAQLVALANLRPGQSIVDLIPGSGYWSRIFSRIVGPTTGASTAIWPQPYARDATGDVQHLRDLGRQYGNIDVLVEPDARLTVPRPVDVVWTSQNYHDYNDKFMGRPGSQSLARDAFRALKPGGLFIVIDHSAAPGRGLGDTETLHRIRTRRRDPRGLSGGLPSRRRKQRPSQPARPADGQGLRPEGSRSHQPVRAQVPQAVALIRERLSG